jgi:hypothetical protein
MQIELTEPHSEILRQYCHKVHISETEVIRQALMQFLSTTAKSQRKLSEHSAFGCWHNKQQEGLAYQYRLRDEWSL